MQMERQSHIESHGERHGERHDERNNRRIREYEYDRKVLFITGIVVLLCWVLILYVNINPLGGFLKTIYDFMLSYMNFSQKVICDMISFLIGIIFMVMFTIITIIFVIITCIPFLVFIFSFFGI